MFAKQLAPEGRFNLPSGAKEPIRMIFGLSIPFSYRGSNSTCVFKKRLEFS
jgi:hypothetical protein